jgi:uncharacterized membrane protein
MAKRIRTKGHIIQWPKEKGQNMSFCPYSFGSCIICPFVLFLLAIVSYVLLSFFFWPLYYMSFCPFSFGHCIICPFVLILLAIVLYVLNKDKRTYDTMAKRIRTKGHIIQWPKEKGQKDI